MLMIERQIRATYSHMLGADVKLPTKNKHMVLTSPYVPSGVVIFWTDRKSPDGKRLFNCGSYRPDGSQPPLFST